MGRRKEGFGGWLKYFMVVRFFERKKESGTKKKVEGFKCDRWWQVTFQPMNGVRSWRMNGMGICLGGK